MAKYARKEEDLVATPPPPPSPFGTGGRWVRRAEEEIQILLQQRPADLPLALCLAKEARRVHHRMGRARAVGSEMSETTLTELLLTELAYCDPARWRIVKYTSEERRTGADWDWWIQKMDLQWIRLRVQAKHLYPDNSYVQLNHKIGGPGGQLQRDVLIESSQREGTAGGVSTFPIYAFYNCLEGARSEPWLCCGLNRYQPLLGITMAPASAVSKLAAARTVRYVDILPTARPFSCVVHCPRGRSVADSAGSHAQALLNGIQWLHGGDVGLGRGVALPGRIAHAIHTRSEVDRQIGDPQITLVTGHQTLDRVGDGEGRGLPPRWWTRGY
ncbi:DUF6615 family protein [Streptomyces sp. NPDC058451]|uniref:DUF6615 family protein n=1 Tax=Streptomyces sp. NPDC058451 TaxID=3346506 RepID=UPI00365A7AFC